MGVDCNDLLGVSITIWENISVYSLVILLPPSVFLLFLLWKLKSSLQILRETADVRAFRGSSLAFLWLVCIVNVARMVIQVLLPYDDHVWKSLWVATRFGDTWLQIFIIIFVALFLVRDVPIAKILAGVGRIDATVKRVLQESIIISTILTIIESVIQALLIFLLHLPIYDTDGGQYAIYWIIRDCLYVTVYAILLCGHLISASNSTYTSNMLSLNDRPEKFGVAKLVTVYIVLMLLISLLNLFAWVLLYFSLDAGVCFVGIDLFVYYSLYPPLVYLIFMARFFETAEHWPLQNKKSLKQQRKQRQLVREQERQRRERELLLKAGEEGQQQNGSEKDVGSNKYSWALGLTQGVQKNGGGPSLNNVGV